MTRTQKNEEQKTDRGKRQRGGAGEKKGKTRLSKVQQLLLGGADEHVVHEQAVVGAAGDHADLDAVGGVPPGEAVEHVQLVLGVQVVDGALAVDQEGVFAQLDVDGAPPHVLAGALLLHDALVLGAAPRLGARAHHQRARVGNEGPRLVLERLLVQDGDRRVAQHHRLRRDPVLFHLHVVHIWQRKGGEEGGRCQRQGKGRDAGWMMRGRRRKRGGERKRRRGKE